MLKHYNKYEMLNHLENLETKEKDPFSKACINRVIDIISAEPSED